MEHHDTCPRHPTCAQRRPEIFAEVAAAMPRVPALSDVGFLPWVGRDYGSGKLFPLLRIMIVGESHYEWCKKCETEKSKRDKDLTTYCIAERMHRIGEPGHIQHWGKIENAFLGKMPSASERRDFWHSVAYYNFLQEVVGFGPRIPVEPALWTDARVHFPTVIESLRPDFIAVAGVGTWRELPPANKLLDALQAGGKTLERRSYHLISGGHSIAGRIAHPSRGLGATWRPVLLEAMARIDRTDNPQ